MPAAKRKLNADDVPVVEGPEAQEQPTAQPEEEITEASDTITIPQTASKTPEWSSFGLEPRLIRAVRDQKWKDPTPVQAQAIPVFLNGKDIIGKSGTGTGKTAAYLLPILHNVLVRKTRETSVLILCPTKELSAQVAKVAKALATHCGDSIRVLNIAGKEASQVVTRAQLAENPHIVVGTPSRAIANVNSGALSLKNLANLVVDEADLVMSYGCKEDLDQLAKNIPTGVQVFLSSATLNTELNSVSSLLCRDPVVVKLEQSKDSQALIKEYYIKCAEDEKFLLVMALFLLKLIKGKSILFVADVERSYRVKLFLEQFGVKSLLLNSELPLASRLNIVESFNKNICDILIASDEQEIIGKDDSKPSAKKAKTSAKPSEKDSGVSRGIDFIAVSNIINFDLPANYKSYQHRIGRTARAGKSGTAISFVIPKDKYRRHKPTTCPDCEKDEEVLAKIEEKQEKAKHQKIENYAFDIKKLEPFRYRFADALRAVTKIAVREARVSELRRELLASQKLTRYFEENPEAAQQLRHDQNLNHPARIQPHLKHVPSYLLPGGRTAEDVGFVGLEKEDKKRPRIVKRKGRVVRAKNGKVDPLKTFNKKGRGKK